MDTKASSWLYCDEIISESPQILAARTRGAEISCPLPSPATGALLQILASSLQAKNIVILGTGAGVTGLYALSAMDEQGTLTCIDPDAENLQAARDAFAAAGIRSSRTRLIAGSRATTIERLADNYYDLVIISDITSDLNNEVTQSLQLLRERGILLVLNALHDDQVPDPARRDEETVAIRNLTQEILADPNFYATVLPVGNGVLLVTKNQQAVL